MIKIEHKYSVLTGKVIGCAMTVHSALGNGFQEVIYQRALAIEMANQCIVFSREHEMPLLQRATHWHTTSQFIGRGRCLCGIEGYHSTG